MSERFLLTTDEAISALPDGDTIHTAIVNGAWIGADWSRDSVIGHITKAGGAQLAGPAATNMGHGVCLDAGRRLFVAHDKDRLAALEAKIAAESNEDADRIIAEIRANK